jgi:hypothetical protein
VSPELLRRDPRTLRHRSHFCPHDVGIDGRLPDPGAEAAVAAGHHVLAADELRTIALEARFFWAVRQVGVVGGDAGRQDA